jgi:hypothetical protein
MGDLRMSVEEALVGQVRVNMFAKSYLVSRKGQSDLSEPMSEFSLSSSIEVRVWSISELVGVVGISPQSSLYLEGVRAGVNILRLGLSGSGVLDRAASRSTR